jgi:predicted phosphoribosyltransferase
MKENESRPTVMLILAWSWAGLPLAWGIAQTLGKAFALFH